MTSETRERLIAWMTHVSDMTTTCAYANSCNACGDAFDGIGDLCPACLRSISDELRRAGEMRELVTAFRAILRHKEIRPPMNQGVQDALEQRCAKALSQDGGTT